ncbi:MAG: methyltransferase domain-containing protein [Halobacteriaceae archaeon]
MTDRVTAAWLSGLPVYALELAGEADEFALAEAAAAGGPPRLFGPGLALSPTLDLDRVRGLAYTRWASDAIAWGAGGLEAALASLDGVDLRRRGSVAVRARDVRGTAGVETQRAERALGDRLVARGFTIDLESPDHELRACFSADSWLLGWRVAASRRDFGQRQPTDRPFFHPGAMAPLLARAVANIAIGRRNPTETVVFDPMLGTGGLLTEAGILGASVLGSDVQSEMVRGARENLRAALRAAQFDVFQADATSLPLADRTADVVAFDAPYGRQSHIAGRTVTELLEAVLAEARRVSQRAVVISDHAVTALARAAGWVVTARFERPVHRSLTRHVHVLE